MNIINKQVCYIVILFCHISLFAQGDTLFVKSSIDFTHFVKSDFKPKVLIIESGSYFLEKPIFFESDIEIIGLGDDNVRIIAKSEMNYFFRAKGKFKMHNIILDGEKLVPYGIMAYSDILIDNCTIRYLYGNKKMSGIAVRSNTSGKKIQITNSKFENISGFEDGKESNSVGAHRALFLKGGDIIIERCKFLNILGNEDADAIHIQDRDSLTSKTVIKDCVFENFGKRAIKLSVSNNSIINNTFINGDDSCYVVIGLIGSSFNLISNNTFDSSVRLAFISISNSTNNEINRNIIKASFVNDTAMVFYVKNVSKTDVYDNVIEMKSVNRLIRNRNKSNGEFFIDSRQIRNVN